MQCYKISYFLGIINNLSNKSISKINKYLRFSSFASMKLLSIKVRKVIKPSNNVMKNINIRNKFLFKNVNIN